MKTAGLLFGKIAISKIAVLAFTLALVSPLASFAQAAKESSSEQKTEVPAEKSEAATPPTKDSLGTPELVTATPGKQIIEYPGYKLEVTLPKDYVLVKVAGGNGISYSLGGPKNTDGTAPGVLILIIPKAPGEEAPLKDVMTEMLKPFATNMKDYKQTEKQPITVEGKSFLNTDFTGVLPSGKAASGFYYIADLKSAYCAIAGRDGADHYKEAEPTLIEIVKSVKILGD